MTQPNSIYSTRAAMKSGDRLHLSYRFAGVEEGEAYVVEHHLFCTISEGKIQRADLLCSGFRPTATSV